MFHLFLTAGAFLSFGIGFSKTAEFPNSRNGNGDKIAEITAEGSSVANLATVAKHFVTLLQLDVGYYLFTPKNLKERYDLKATISSLTSSPFDAKLKTKFLINGYGMDLNNASVFYDIKDELLREGNYNVIIVDWTKYNKYSYSISSVTAMLTGMDIANLIEFLIKNAGITAESVHIIGHSLGGHVAGFAGKGTPNLGRITGLDTAGHDLFCRLPNVLKLHHTDAMFVDAIHTNGASCGSGGYGTLLPYGDIDFFPNGGSSQPGCDFNVTFRYTNNEIVYVNTSKKQAACSHNRAPFLFLESIRRCNFPSELCDSYKSIMQRECLPEGECPSGGSVTANMGFRAQPSPSLPPKSTFFLRTQETSPFCIHCDKNQ